MRFRGVLVGLAVLTWAGTAAAQKFQTFFPYPLKVATLPNGLRVVRVPFESPGLVSYYTVVRVGSRNEVEADHTGFAHYFEHVMFKGTKAWPEGTRDALLGRLGFSENAFTTDDVTVYFVNGPSTSLDKLVELEADRFRNLEYSEATFQTEAKAVLGEYHKNAANPGLKMEEELAATAFKVHPYRHTTLGFYDDIKKMPGYFEYSREFFRRWYTPDNTLVFVVGDFDDAKLMAWVEKGYGSWQGKAAKLVIPAEPAQKEARQVHVDWATPTLPRHLHAWHTPSAGMSLTDGAVQSVLSAYLAGPTSPLYKQLVLEQQLCESVSTGYGEHRDPSLFSLTATLKEERHRAAVQAAFDAAVRDAVSGKLDAKRVQDIKDNLRYSLLMGLETADHVAMQLAYFGGVLGGPGSVDALYQAIAQVKPAQVSAFAKRHLTDSNRTVLTLTPKPAAEKAGQP